MHWTGLLPIIAGISCTLLLYSDSIPLTPASGGCQGNTVTVHTATIRRANRPDRACSNTWRCSTTASAGIPQ